MEPMGTTAAAEQQPAIASAPATTTATSGEFGTSEFGERLDYTQPKYQDLWAMVLFYIHVVIIIVLIPVMLADVEDEYTPSPTIPGVIYFSYDSADDSDDEYTADLGAAFACLAIALVVGSLFALMWLQCLRLYAEQIIKIILGLTAAMFTLAAISCFAADIAGLGIFYLLVLGVFCLWVYCIRSRIPFASVLLSIASQIAQMYHGLIYLSFLTAFICFIWFIVWIVSFILCLVIAGLDQIGIFLMIVSLYWGNHTWNNVAHTTTCGVTATWYFFGGVLENPSRAAFKRTMTTSFGSVAFGSLLTAILSTIRAMIKMSGRNPCAYCIILCIERLMRYFNRYAFAQCAIYGTNFITSAKATWNLFLAKGFTAVTNDSLAGMALTFGAIVGAIVSGLAGYFISTLMVDNVGIIAFVTVFSFWLGYVVVRIVLMVVASGVVGLFVCFAEDPAALAESRPEAYNRLVESSDKIQKIVADIQPAPAVAAGRAPAQGQPTTVVVVQQPVQQPVQTVMVVQQPPPQ